MQVTEIQSGPPVNVYTVRPRISKQTCFGCAASELNLLRTIIMRAYVVGVWDYCAELRARMMNLTAKGLFQLQ